jgi:hypothetical protein
LFTLPYINPVKRNIFGSLNSNQIIQGDFEGCADILTCDRTPKKVTIEPIMPYTNVDIFREKGAKSVSKKKLGVTEFYENMGPKKISRLFCCHLIQNYVTDKNLNLNLSLNHKWLSRNRYGFDGHSELARQSTVFSQCTNLSKHCAASSRFRAFRNEQARSWPFNEKITF